MTDTFNDHETRQSPAADEIKEQIRLPAQGLQELVARNAQGSIRIRTADRDDVLVHAIKGGHPQSRRYREASLLLEEHDGRIFVRPHIPGGPGWLGLGVGGGFFKRGPGRFDFDIDFDQLKFGFGGDVWFDIEIELPRQTANPNPAISVRNASGEVEVAGVNGQISVATASGDVVLNAVDGDIRVMTASGEATITGATGRLTAGSASGDIAITDSTLTGCKLATASGDHHVTAALTSTGPYRFDTVSGDVILNLKLPLAGGATDPAARLEFSTVSGDADITPPFRSTGRKGWASGEARQPAALLRVKTVSGDLRLRALGDPQLETVEAPTEPFTAEGEMPTAPHPPTPPTPPTPPFPPFPPFPSVSEALTAASEHFAEQAQAMSVRAMQQAAEAMERAAAKMRPFSTVPETKRPGADSPASSPPDAPAAAPAASEASAPVPAPEARPAPSPEEERQRLDVLQALERGEIDIDEAMSRLDALEPDGDVAPLAAEAAPESPPAT